MVLIFSLISSIRHLLTPLHLPRLLKTQVIPLFPQSYRRARLLLGQRGEAQVGLDDLHLGEHLLGLGALNGGVDDDVVAWGFLISYMDLLVSGAVW